MYLCSSGSYNVQYLHRASKNWEQNYMCAPTTPLNASMDGSSEDLAGEGVPPQNSPWEQRMLVDLNPCWDDLIFVSVVGSCTAWNHRGEVMSWIDGYKLVMNLVHQEETNCLSASFKGVPLEIFNHFGDTFHSAVIVKHKPGSLTLDVFYFSDVLLCVWIQTGLQYSR